MRTECGMMYARVSCFVVCGCAVSRRYIDVCNCDVFYPMYNVPTHKTDRLQILQNQYARILTKSPRREHITPA